jgi:hypothetical protein
MGIKSTSKVVTKVTEWFWQFDCTYSVIAFVGADHEKPLTLQTRKVCLVCMVWVVCVGCVDWATCVFVCLTIFASFLSPLVLLFSLFLSLFNSRALARSRP